MAHHSPEDIRREHYFAVHTPPGGFLIHLARELTNGSGPCRSEFSTRPVSPETLLDKCQSVAKIVKMEMDE